MKKETTWFNVILLLLIALAFVCGILVSFYYKHPEIGIGCFIAAIISLIGTAWKVVLKDIKLNKEIKETNIKLGITKKEDWVIMCDKLFGEFPTLGRQVKP